MGVALRWQVHGFGGSLCTIGGQGAALTAFGRGHPGKHAPRVIFYQIALLSDSSRPFRAAVGHPGASDGLPSPGLSVGPCPDAVGGGLIHALLESRSSTSVTWGIDTYGTAWAHAHQIHL